MDSVAYVGIVLGCLGLVCAIGMTVRRICRIHPLPIDRGDGTVTDMEAGVKKLEDDFTDIKTDLKSLVKDVAEIKSRVLAMPTWPLKRSRYLRRSTTWRRGPRAWPSRWQK